MEAWIVPLVQQLGLGGITGFIAGYAFKKLTKIVAIMLGIIFILVQYLAYKHFININWGEIGDAAAPHLADSGKSAAAAVWEVLRHNLPFGGAFTAGFVLGLKKG
ncbi:MAG: FUN14 domain-containing protein [Armatimonadota bacterium]